MIYWEGEQSVSVKPVSSVRNCTLGELGLVDNKYKGKVIGLGKCGNTAGYKTHLIQCVNVICPNKKINIKCTQTIMCETDL